MRARIRVFVVIGVLMAVFSGSVLAEDDAKGCKDHPFFSRMPNYYLTECKSSEFDSYEFYDPDTQGKSTVVVEGRRYDIAYRIKRDFRDKRATPLQIIRNHENAVKKFGGTTYSWTGIGGGQMYAKYKKAGMETWARVFINENGDHYTITIVEKGEMKQDVVSDAKTMAADINATGRVALYGIYFDFNKAEVKPESSPTLDEIAKLLKQNAALKLYVVGHTDNAGGYDYNMRLSQARADAVVKVLVANYGISRDRLRPAGVGSLAPLASNDTKDGQAKNRRVELVKQ